MRPNSARVAAQLRRSTPGRWDLHKTWTVAAQSRQSAQLRQDGPCRWQLEQGDVGTVRDQGDRAWLLVAALSGARQIPCNGCKSRNSRPLRSVAGKVTTESTASTEWGALRAPTLGPAPLAWAALLGVCTSRARPSHAEYRAPQVGSQSSPSPANEVGGARARARSVARSPTAAQFPRQVVGNSGSGST
jgi:hypothetical protein